MQGIQQKFKTSYKSWTQKDRNQVENFFLSNSFFSKFYQSKKFEQIARLCLYRKLQANESMILQNNNRAQAIVLLSGQVSVKRLQRSRGFTQRVYLIDSQTSSQMIQKITRVNSKRNNSQSIQQVILFELKHPNQTIILNSQCSVYSHQHTASQIIFIPCALYYKLQSQTQSQRVSKIQLVLERFFYRLQKRDIYEISLSNCCLFKQFKMNNYIYRASSKPQEVFLLVQGIVKLEKAGFSQRTLQETIVVNKGMMFGDNDLKNEERTRNAIACSAHVEVLSIAKSQYIKYLSKAHPDIQLQHVNLQLPYLPHIQFQVSKTSRSINHSPSTRINLFPSVGKLRRFHANTQRQQTKLTEMSEKRQYELIKNSHILVDIRSKAKSNFKMRTISPNQKNNVVADRVTNNRQRSLKIKDLRQLNIYNYN